MPINLTIAAARYVKIKMNIIANLYASEKLV